MFKLPTRRSERRGSVYLVDKRTKSDVSYKEGESVKEFIDMMCKELGIIPVARAFFGLCHLKNGRCLSPYQRLSQQEARHDYQLRLVVHLYQNSLILQRLSKGAYNYYYDQVKHDFLHDELYPPVSVNTKAWMTGIDIARQAMLSKESFDVLVKRKAVLDACMPPSLKKPWNSDMKIRDSVKQVFEKFNDAGFDSENHFKAKYLEVYEQDKMCGIHVFKATWSNGTHTPNTLTLTLISSESGISRVMKGADGESKQQKVCSIGELRKVDVQLPKMVTISFERDLSEASAENDDVLPSKWVLLFASTEEMVCFATLLNAYYQIMVDANVSILEGTPSIVPSDDMLRISEHDDFKKNLCHGAISPDSVEKILEMYNKDDGTFLIRESRSTEDSYTLSLCHSQRIKNFRISKDADGTLSLRDPGGPAMEQPVKQFASMAALVEHHSREKDGLPTHLKRNCSPTEVAKTAGPIPLIIVKHVATQRDSSPSTSDGTDTSNPATLDSPQFAPLPLGEVPMSDSLSQRPKHPKTEALVSGGVTWIPFEQLKLTKKLGSPGEEVFELCWTAVMMGHFSNVYAATWSCQSRQSLEVAVKVPNVDSEEVDAVMNDLEREITTMHSLDHKHIVKLLGISDAPHFLTLLGGRIPLVIMEFVRGGSLRSYLQGLQERSHTEPRTAQNSRKTLLLFSEQIANGMEYLENQKLVHRDLAARNVLIESDKLVKISDFGLSRAPTKSDYYYSNNLKELPIFWYAPECLKNRRFTSKGDVWSYGITLWEMFTLGRLPTHVFQAQLRHFQPPPGQPAVNIHTQMVRMLTEGTTHTSTPPPPLPKVAPCSSDIYEIMLDCWQVKPEDRPNFRDLQIKVALVATQL